MGMALCHLDVNIVRVAKAHGDGVVVNEKDAQHALDLVRANPQRVAHVVHAMLHEQVRVVAHVLVRMHSHTCMHARVSTVSIYACNKVCACACIDVRVYGRTCVLTSIRTYVHA